MSQCQNDGQYRYTWPGKDETVICLSHVLWLKDVATAMGLHLQIIPLSEGDSLFGLKCPQEIEHSQNDQL